MTLLSVLDDMDVDVTPGSMADCERSFLSRHHQWLRRRRPRSYRQWSVVEDDAVRRLGAVWAVPDACRGRTEAAVRTRALHLGLPPLPPAVVAPERWDAAEDAVVREHFARWSKSRLRRALPGRSWPRIWRTALRLGVASRLTEGRLSMSAAARALGVAVPTLRAACVAAKVKTVAYPPGEDCGRRTGVYATPDEYAQAYAQGVASNPLARERIADRSLGRLLELVRDREGDSEESR